MRTLPCLVIGLTLAAASTAHAQTLQQTTQQVVVVSSAQPVETTETARQEGPRPLDLDELSTLNGRQGNVTAVVISDQDLNAINQGNTITANSVGSGQITIDRGAFEGFAGVGNFVINSGHNNNLQGALTINIVSP